MKDILPQIQTFNLDDLNPSVNFKPFLRNFCCMKVDLNNFKLIDTGDEISIFVENTVKKFFKCFSTILTIKSDTDQKLLVRESTFI